MKKFYIHTMGCKSNQFESSIIIENLTSKRLEQVKSIEEADYFILNSCTVTHKSDNEAFYLLRSEKHKNAGPAPAFLYKEGKRFRSSELFLVLAASAYHAVRPLSFESVLSSEALMRSPKTQPDAGFRCDRAHT